MDIDTGILDPSRYVKNVKSSSRITKKICAKTLYYNPFFNTFAFSFVMGGSNSPTTEELLSGGNRSGTGRYKIILLFPTIIV